MANRPGSGQTPRQLPLPVALRPDARLDALYAGANQWVIDWLKERWQEPPAPTDSVLTLFLHAPPGSGLTHWLQAICQFAETGAQSAFYLALPEVARLGPDCLTGLEDFSCVCLDDTQAVLHDPAWQEALFHLYNRLQTRGQRLVVGSQVAWVDWSGVILPDLHSRLAAGLQVSLKRPDEDWPQAVWWLARQHGLDLKPDAARYLADRGPRDWRTMASLLRTLDQQALAAKRRLTVPFIRQALHW